MSTNVAYEGLIKGFPLIKLQTKEIIALIKNGNIRFNSLKLYRELYNKNGDKTIGDPNEGKFILHDAIFSVPEAGIEQPLQDYPFSTANENDFVFCMFGINPQRYTSFTFTEEQKEKLMGFHDSALLITDPFELTRRICDAANMQNIKVTSGFVNYYDKTIDDINRIFNLCQNGMESVVYYKTNDYAYQQEYRFAIANTTGEDYIDLHIGDISDITHELTTQQILYHSKIQIR